MYERLPKLKSVADALFISLIEDRGCQYVVFGSVLLPALEGALAARDLGTILRVCAFLEDAAEAAQQDVRLGELLRIEVGEWLGSAANEELLASWLGAETKRICNHVPGLATQRRALREERTAKGIRRRIAAFVNRFKGK